MTYYQKAVVLLFVFACTSCGRNDKKEELQAEPNQEQKLPPKVETNPGLNNTKDSVLATSADSSKVAINESILKKQNYKKKKQIVTTNDKIVEVTGSVQVSKSKSVAVPSHYYIKKILELCKVGIPMTQEDLKANFNIPEEAMQLVKSVTKVSSNELDIKWKSTWFIEKMSDAKFNDGRLKLHFDKNKMYTSGNAIAIKYKRKLYTDLIITGRAARIPSVKGFYWQIGKD